MVSPSKVEGPKLKSGERLFGMIFTTIGIALLLIVFYLAFEMLTHPVPGLKAALAPAPSVPASSVSPVETVSGSILAFLLKLAVLFIMTLAGSHIAGRGIQLFHGGSHTSTGLKPGSLGGSNERNISAAPRSSTETTELQ